MTIQPVILAGGSGTRLWPLSRRCYPKQFLALMDEHTLLQECVSRLDGLNDLDPLLFVSNEEHRFLITEQVRQLGDLDPMIVLEPEGRNTAPALTLAAQTVKAIDGHDDDPIMLVMPADHIIRDIETFQSAVNIGAALASRGNVVTFGVRPDSPNTGYGYIKAGLPVSRSSISINGAGQPDGSRDDSGPWAVETFVEKPDFATATRFLDSGDYFWNSGIFMMRCSVWLELIERFRPEIASHCENAYLNGVSDGRFFRPDKVAFSACPTDSIDYAVIENLVRSVNDGDDADRYINCVVLPLDAGWSDVGSWSAVWEEGEKDESGNVAKGDTYLQDTSDSVIIGQSRLVAAVGLEDIIVVETPDAVLVAHKNSVQKVRDIVNRLQADKRPESELHRKVHRPWGTYEVVDSGPRFQTKRLTVNPGAALSLQMHHHRAEHWVVVSGTATVTKGEESYLLTENESTYISVGVKHRLENSGTIPLEIIEVQSGSYLGEDDIVRFEDRYNRQSTNSVSDKDEPERSLANLKI